MLLPDNLVFWFSVSGVCALAFGARKLGIALILPGTMKRFVRPAVITTARSSPPGVTGVGIPLCGLALLFLALRLLQRLLAIAFGQEAAGLAIGTYLVRIFDLIGRSVLSLARLPFSRRTPSHRRSSKDNAHGH